MKSLPAAWGLGFCLAAVAPASAWEAVSTGTTSDLFSLQFPAGDTGFAVGTTAILKTVDRGDHWTLQPNGREFRTAYFLNGSLGWAASASNGLYRTMDGGQNWDSLSGIRFPIYSITFVDSNRGWIVMDPMDTLRIQATQDGGHTWTQVFHKKNPTTPNSYYTHLAFVHSLSNSSDSGHMGVAYYSYLSTQSFPGGESHGSRLITGDGGQSWTESSIASWKSGYQQGGRTWLIMGYPTIKVTSATSSSPLGCGHQCVYTYGPASHNLIRRISPEFPEGANVGIPAGDYQYLQAVHFLGKDTGIAVGTAGLIVRTNDGGASWNAEATSGIGSLSDVKIVSRSKAFAVGPGGTLLKTDPTLPFTVGVSPARSPSRAVAGKLSGTTFRYTLPYATSVSIRVSDSRGKSIWHRTTVEAPGAHSLQLPTSALPPGNYFVDFRAGGLRESLRFNHAH